MKDPYYMKMTRDRQMSRLAFFGSAGGWLGLCCGLSIISVCKTVYHDITIMIIIINVTRPKPAYGRHGLAGSWGQDTDEVSTFLVFLTSHFAPAALSSDLTNLGPLTMESDQKP